MVSNATERQGILRESRKRQIENNINVRNCLSKGFLHSIQPSLDLSEKELTESDYDLAKAEESQVACDYKWCMIQCYYAMFHSAKGLLYAIGFSERSHSAVISTLQAFAEAGYLESRFVNNLRSSVFAREEADYHYSYSKQIAEHELKMANEFVAEMKRQIKLMLA